ncbi:LysR family transcriptional regulator [Priestia koreensis]|uniref:LysR family transcriptional regulator n=1 Tax=Priestia koreensis TaxID=284581 RepID=UPI001F590F9F|nr:LysR family transcriptional regulator [Priestia koreensis]UNL83747.1 LysR family transcriptional regulator [Priestia koreensis]
MELQDLEIFRAVAAHGTISGAAKALGYVQPHITERIKRLEEAVRSPLFERTNRGVLLLPSGEVLLEYANRILQLVEEAKDQIHQQQQIHRIATSPSILSAYLRDRIRSQLSHYDIYEHPTQRLKFLLTNGDVDLVITYSMYTDQSLKIIHQSSLTFGLIAAHQDVDIPTNYFFVSHDPECPFRNHTLHYMQKENIPVTQLKQVDSYSFIEELVEQGQGVAFLPVQHRQLQVVETIPLQEVPIYMYTRQGSRTSLPDKWLQHDSSTLPKK